MHLWILNNIYTEATCKGLDIIIELPDRLKTSCSGRLQVTTAWCAKPLPLKVQDTFNKWLLQFLVLQSASAVSKEKRSQCTFTFPNAQTHSWSRSRFLFFTFTMLSVEQMHIWCTRCYEWLVSALLRVQFRDINSEEFSLLPRCPQKAVWQRSYTPSFHFKNLSRY